MQQESLFLCIDYYEPITLMQLALVNKAFRARFHHEIKLRVAHGIKKIVGACFELEGKTLESFWAVLKRWMSSHGAIFVGPVVRYAMLGKPDFRRRKSGPADADGDIRKLSQVTNSIHVIGGMLCPRYMCQLDATYMIDLEKQINSRLDAAQICAMFSKDDTASNIPYDTRMQYGALYEDAWVRSTRIHLTLCGSPGFYPPQRVEILRKRDEEKVSMIASARVPSCTDPFGCYGCNRCYYEGDDTTNAITIYIHDDRDNENMHKLQKQRNRKRDAVHLKSMGLRYASAQSLLCAYSPNDGLFVPDVPDLLRSVAQDDPPTSVECGERVRRNSKIYLTPLAEIECYKQSRINTKQYLVGSARKVARMLIASCARAMHLQK